MTEKYKINPSHIYYSFQGCEGKEYENYKQGQIEKLEIIINNVNKILK